MIPSALRRDQQRAQLRLRYGSRVGGKLINNLTKAEIASALAEVADIPEDWLVDRGPPPTMTMDDVVDTIVTEDGVSLRVAQGMALDNTLVHSLELFADIHDGDPAKLAQVEKLHMALIALNDWKSASSERPGGEMGTLRSAKPA